MKSAAFFVPILAILLAAARPVYSQDRIVKINNDTIRAKVIKITKDKIQFRYPGMASEKLSEIHKNSVKEVIYANGTRLRIIYNLYEVSPDLQVETKRVALKADLGAPFLNHLTFGVEYCLKTGLNLELKGGVIGPGFSSALNPAEGFLIKAGVKFVDCATGLSRGQKYLDPMRGTYLKPEIIYSHFIEHAPARDVTYNHYAINFILGQQYLVWECISLEFFGGLGAGIKDSDFEQTSTYNKEEEDFNYAYSHLFFGHEFPLILSGGLTVGFVF